MICYDITNLPKIEKLGFRNSVHQTMIKNSNTFLSTYSPLHNIKIPKESCKQVIITLFLNKSIYTQL